MYNKRSILMALGDGGGSLFRVFSEVNYKAFDRVWSGLN